MAGNLRFAAGVDDNFTQLSDVQGMGRAWDYDASVKCDTVLADSDEIDIRGVSGGSMVIATTTNASLAVYAANVSGGTYVPAYDGLGAAITMTVASDQAIKIPDSIFNFHWIKFVAPTADVTVACNWKA